MLGFPGTDLAGATEDQSYLWFSGLGLPVT